MQDYGKPYRHADSFGVSLNTRFKSGVQFGGGVGGFLAGSDPDDDHLGGGVAGGYGRTLEGCGCHLPPFLCPNLCASSAQGDHFSNRPNVALRAAAR